MENKGSEPSLQDSKGEPSHGTEPSLTLFDKRLGTNLAALILTLSSIWAVEPWKQSLLQTGLFALSGAVTNWLAIHMLFERVPGLYGSGIIPLHFEDFKRGIHDLIMKQFFSKENVERFFMSENGKSEELPNMSPLIEKIDLNPAFDSLLKVIQESSFGPMLAMVGGIEVLQPLRQPFLEKMRGSLTEISETTIFRDGVSQLILDHSKQENIHEKVSVIVKKRLEELTPVMVKEIIERMIAEHLGWLVVWGGIFGGLIGLITSIFINQNLYLQW